MKIQSRTFVKFFFAGIITLGILLFVFLISLAPGIKQGISYANFWLRSLLFSLEFPLEIFGRDFPIKNNIPHPSLLLVAIDDRTLRDEEYGGLGRWQEFKRVNYAKAIENLKSAWAIVIGVDVLFSEKAEGDDILAASIKEAGNVVLWFSYGSEELLFPVPILREAAYSIGYFQPYMERSNDMVYGIIPSISNKKYGTHEAFSLKILRKYLDVIYNQKSEVYKDASLYEEVYRFHTGKYEFLPLAGKGYSEILINYPLKGQSYQTLSFVDVYNNRFNPALVKDKIVVIWATATGLHDEFFTPTGIMYGAVVHMNFISTILKQNYLTYVPILAQCLIIAFLTLFFTLFLIHVESRSYQIGNSIITLFLGVVFYIAVFLSSRILTHPIQLIIVIILSTSWAMMYKYIYEEKGKRLLKNMLSQYLAEDLVTSVLANYEEVKLWGTKKEVTLFFSDIAGFTTISEGMDPEELVRFLSFYLKDVSDIIIKERGFVNKYVGDAVMAIWGAFWVEKQQSYLACKSALLQQQAIAKRNAQFKQDFGFNIKVRMGINRGQAVVGNIGSEGHKIEYTALGDTVNTASRLEAVNKMYDTLICVGESVAKNEQEHFVFRKLDSIMVKGKDLPVVIYELVGFRGLVSDTELDKIAHFEVALGLYQTRHFEEAKKIFTRLIETHDDGPSKTFLQRCEAYIKNGCPPDWKGDYRATEK